MCYVVWSYVAIAIDHELVIWIEQFVPDSGSWRTQWKDSVLSMLLIGAVGLVHCYGSLEVNRVCLLKLLVYSFSMGGPVVARTNMLDLVVTTFNLLYCVVYMCSILGCSDSTPMWVVGVLYSVTSPCSYLVSESSLPCAWGGGEASCRLGKP